MLQSLFDLFFVYQPFLQNFIIVSLLVALYWFALKKLAKVLQLSRKTVALSTLAVILVIGLLALVYIAVGWNEFSIFPS